MPEIPAMHLPSETLLKGKDFGLKENIKVSDHVISTEFPDPRLPENRKVSVHAYVWKNDKTLPEDANQGEALCMWGLASSAHDAVQAIPALAKNYERVVCVSHPDAADATINHPDIPLNTDSFQNGGRVTLDTIQQLVDRGELRPGITVYGHSTGNAILMEAIALDCRLSKENPQRIRLISKAVFMAPAAIINWDTAKHITREAEKTPLQVIKDEAQRAKRDRQESGRTGMKQAEHVLQLLGTKPGPSEKRMSYKDVRNNPEWKNVRIGNIAFESIERVFNTSPIFDDFRQRLHLHWPDRLPHMWSPGATADVRHNIELVSTNCTDTAGKTITDTPVSVILFDEDTAVPPERFLTKVDHDAINNIQLNDREKQNLQEQIARIRSTRDEAYVREVENRIEPMTLQRKREEKRRELIADRVKEKFPNNPDTSVEILSWEHHAAERRGMGLIGAIAQRDFQKMT